MDRLSIDALNCTKYGQTIFVMGTSYSLEFLDLSLLEGKTVLGVNQSLWKYIPAFAVINDRSAFESVRKCVTECVSSCKAVSVPLILRKGVGPLSTRVETYQYELKTGKDLRFKGPLQQVDNTAYYAIEIALRMRGSHIPGRIVLLGVDLFYHPCYPSHFFGDGKEMGCRPNFGKVLKALAHTRDFMKKRRIDLVTCSPWEGPVTEILPRMTLEEAVK